MKNFLLILLICLISFYFGSICLASPSPSNISGSVSLTGLDPTKGAQPAGIIGNIVASILSVIGAVALFMVIYGGLLMLTSAGNTEKIQKGKNVLTWSLIGLAVIFGSYVLTSYIISGLTGKDSSDSDAEARCKAQWGENATCRKLSHPNCNALNGDELTYCLTDAFDNLTCKVGLCGDEPDVICCEEISQ